jgi:hypothetical protein
VLHCRLLAPSISTGVVLAALLFASAAAADPIPDGIAPSPEAPAAPAVAPSAVVAPTKAEIAPHVEAPTKQDPPVKAEANAPKAAPGSRAASSSRSRTAAREPMHCPPGRRGAKPSAGACADPDAVAGVAVKKIHSGPHLEVVARDLRLDDTSRERLERIAQRYFEATRRRLVVTGGTRTPERQAELMLEKLVHGEDIVALYENKAAVTEIRNLYRESSGVRQPKKQLIHALRDVITAQMDRGVYVSRHLKAGAADVRSRDLKAPQEAAFRRAVADEPGVILIDERASAEPHLHLGL